jgi:hypothetical protein
VVSAVFVPSGTRRPDGKTEIHNGSWKDPKKSEMTIAIRPVLDWFSVVSHLWASCWAATAQ